MVLQKQTKSLAGLLLLLAFVGMSVDILAVEVMNLYDAEVPVRDQSTEIRQEAFPKALERVLIRLSGNRSIAEMPEGRNILAVASRYVLQYQYQSVELVKNRTGASSLLLKVEFDGRALIHRMQRGNLPVWGSNRPSTLIWLGIQQGYKRRILAEGDEDEVRTVLDTEAYQRGLPLLFPLMDLDDRAQVEFADIGGGFATRVLDASARYEADIVVTGVLVQQNDKAPWTSHWTVYRDKVSSRWTSHGSLQDVVTAGIDGIADILASRYAVKGGEQDLRNEIRLEITHILRLQNYAKVLNHLKSLSSVISVQPIFVHGDTVRYKLLIQGDQQNLERAIILGRVLVPVVKEENLSVLPLQTDNALIVMDDIVDLFYRFRD